MTPNDARAFDFFLSQGDSPSDLRFTWLGNNTVHLNCLNDFVVLSKIPTCLKEDGATRSPMVVKDKWAMLRKCVTVRDGSFFLKNSVFSYHFYNLEDENTRYNRMVTEIGRTEDDRDVRKRKWKRSLAENGSSSVLRVRKVTRATQTDVTITPFSYHRISESETTARSLSPPKSASHLRTSEAEQI